MAKQKHSLLSKKIDIIFLILSPIFATFVSLTFKTNFLISTLLFFGIPAIYLSWRNTHAIKKSFLFSSIIGIFGAFVIDYFATVGGFWFVPKTVFPLRLLGVVPIEDLIWGFLLVYGIVMFYEHFLDKGKHNLKDTNLKYLIISLIFIFITFFLIYLFKPFLLVIPYFYIKAGIIIILFPIISFLSFFPKLISKFIKAGTYFFIQGILFELTGLTLNQWNFDGTNFIGWVQILNLKFPLEEFVFWMVLFSTCVLSYYEFFDDDRK